MTVPRFIATIESKRPPARADQLEKLEAELGRKLAADYRKFLVACNGGYVGGRLWFRGTTPSRKRVEVGVSTVGGFRRKYSLKWARDCYKGRIPESLLWIMNDPFGNAICLGVEGKHRGKIYFWDHEREPDPEKWDGRVETAGNVWPLAKSFTDFVAGLGELTDE